MKVIFRVFGVGNGVSTSMLTNNVNVLLDARRIQENPFKYLRLRALTGLHKPVIDWLRNTRSYELLFNYYYSRLLTAMHQANNTDKELFIAAVYCHGGRHRSVVLANDLASRIVNDHEIFQEQLFKANDPKIVYYNGAVAAFKHLIDKFGYDKACEEFMKTEHYRRH